MLILFYNSNLSCESYNNLFKTNSNSYSEFANTHNLLTSLDTQIVFL